MPEDYFAQCRQGDTAAFGAVVQQFAPKLYTISYFTLGSAHDAESATQEAFIKIFRSLSHGRKDDAPKIWMYRTLVHICKNSLRARGQFRPITPEASAAPKAPSAKSSAKSATLSCDMRPLLASLPTDYVLILLLCDMEGFSPLEAAQMLDCPPDTAKTRLAHARNLLFDRFSKAEQNSHATLSALLDALRALPEPALPSHLQNRILSSLETKAPREETINILHRILSSWQFYSILAAGMLLFTLLYSQHADWRFVPPKTTPYVSGEAPLPSGANLPTYPFGPQMQMPIPTPSPSQEGVSLLPPALPSVSVQPDVRPESLPEIVPQPPSNPAPSFHVPQPSVPAPTKKPAAPSPAPVAKVYPAVGSLVKRNVTFVVNDPAAASVFQNTKHDGVEAVKHALYQNGFSFSTRESVVEEYAATYNALAREATALAQKIADGQGGNLARQLAQKEREMEALKNSCNAPTLSLAYQ